MHFYDCYGRIALAGDLIGSVCPGANNSSSSVIMASWPRDGTEVCTTRVGCVQYFKHQLLILDNEQSNTQQIEHIFAYVHVMWKKQHRHYA